MKMKRIFSVAAISALVLAMTTSCTDLFTQTEKEKDEIEKILYSPTGVFPRSIKQADVTVDEGSAVTHGDFTFYKGSDGEHYVKVAAAPYIEEDDSGNPVYEPAFSDGTKIAKGTSYYFKVEPIKWQTISEEEDEAGDKTTRMLVAKEILYAEPFNTGFDASDKDFNSYDKSAIRARLNSNFLQSAFKDGEYQGNLIQTYDEGKDKVWLLGRDELKQIGGAELLQRKPTDYALATGAYVEAGGAGCWRLRDAVNTAVDQSGETIDDDGTVNFYAAEITPSGSTGASYVQCPEVGIVPCIKVVYDDAARQ